MLRSRWLTAVLVVVGVAAPVLGQDQELKWKFEKGKTFYQKMTTKTDQEMTVMGQKITQNQTQTFYFSWTPVEQDDKTKDWKVKQKIEGVEVNIQIGGTPITYDSTKEGGASSSPMGDFFKALVGAEFTLTISPEMKVTKIEGREPFIKKLISTNQTMEPLLNQILSEDSLKQMSDPAFGVVPGKAVKKGDTPWTRSSKLNMGPIGTYDTEYKYTYEGPDDKDKNLAKIKVDTTLKYTPPQAGATGALPFKIVSADLKSKDATGTVLFDVAKGRLSSSDLSMKLEGKLSIDINGMTSEVELNQTQKTSITTSDTNPAEKKAPDKPADKKEDKK